MGPSYSVFVRFVNPFLYGFYLTFTDYSPISITYDLVGLSNYKEVFSDKEFWGQFFKTLRYVFYSTVFCNLLAFILAYLLTSNIRGRNFLRGGFFTPNLIGGIVLGYIWKFIFANVVTQLGSITGYEALTTSFLTHPERAIVAMIIVTVGNMPDI